MATTKLEVLTPEQDALIPVVRESWLNYILSCKNTIQKEDAAKGIKWLYKFCKKEEPIIIFMDSPFGCQVAANFFKEYLKKDIGANIRANIRDNIRDNIGANIRANIGANIRANIRDNIWDNIGANIRDNIRDNIRANIGDNIRANIRANIGDNIRDNIRANIGANIRANIRDNIWDNIGANIRDNIWDNIGANIWDNIGANKIEWNDFSWYGNCGDYGWVAFIDYFMQLDLPTIKNSEDFQKFKHLLLSGVFDMIQLDGICLVTSMPTEIVRNPEGFLHNSFGMAVRFKDGYGQYYLNGRSMPEWIFSDYKNGTLSFDKFNKEKNEDIRAGIITMIKEVEGSEGLIKFLGAEEIDVRIVTHPNDYIETIRLFRTTGRFPELQNRNGDYNQPAAWLSLICPSTGQNYLIDTCPLFENAIECAKWHRPKRVSQEVPYLWSSAN